MMGLGQLATAERGPLGFVSAIALMAAIAGWTVLGPLGAGLGFAIVWMAWLVTTVALRSDSTSANGAARRAILPVLAIGLLPLAVPDLLLRTPSPRRGLVVLLAAAVWFLVYLVLARGTLEPVLDLVERRASVLLALAIVGHVGLSIGFLAVKYGQSLDFITGDDMAYHVQLLWNTLNGRFLQGTVLQQISFAPPVSSDFALHVNPLLLALLPGYAVAPGAVVLVALRNVALALGAIPVFWLLARHTDRAFGLLGALIYLLHPTTIAQSLLGFYPIQLAAPLLILTILFYRRERFGPFIASLVATISAREDVALVAAMLGGLALLEKRSLRWIVTPVALCIPWWVVSYFVVMPAFGADGGKGYRAVAGLMAGGPLSQLDTLLGHVLSLPVLNYVYQSLKPVGLTALADPTSLLLLPVVGINALLAIVFRGAPLKPHFYFSALVPAIIALSLLGAARIARHLPATGLPLRTVRLAVLGFAFPLLILGAKDVIAAAVDTVQADFPLAPPTELLRLIPEEAAVAAPYNLLPTLARREQLYWVERISDYSVTVQPEYIVIAEDAPAFRRLDTLQNPSARAKYARVLASLDSDGYSMIWANAHYRVYKRR